MKFQMNDLMQALRAIHRSRPEPEHDPWLAGSIMAAVRELGLPLDTRFMRLALPISAVACVGAALLFAVSSTTPSGSEGQLMSYAMGDPSGVIVLANFGM
ncbi:hypothetical protein [Pseudodesulfovibrio senegalensis]|jgi:hypothetical protein|uniref:Uncharacterized protein n=1 Tax=Pseudodesulfovibrio senegalensis TaxID=1721087 RepID=A0A6N6N4E4_9BACT|nr:hypothetical protein [Pseudodesulfovibrio senegalensis]KAB1442956.1 hypothetical protein F8A88_01400 [Pseudodesulfovibrio senegalensis]